MRGDTRAGGGRRVDVSLQRLRNLATRAGVDQRHRKSEGETNYGQVERVYLGSEEGRSGRQVGVSERRRCS